MGLRKPRKLDFDDQQIRDPLALFGMRNRLATFKMLEMLGLHGDAREGGLCSLSFAGTIIG
jgi:hypothetical protein